MLEILRIIETIYDVQFTTFLWVRYSRNVLFMEIVRTLLIAMKIDDLFSRIANIREQIVS